jgi:acetyl esterase/lipase
MPLDRHARRFLDMMAAAGATRGRYEDAGERRHALENLAAAADPPGAVPVGGVRDQFLPTESGSILSRVYTPRDRVEETLPGMVFFHGGGWVAGSLNTHDGLCRRLANASGCRVIAIEYRLAPEHPFPRGLEDGLAAFHHVASSHASFGIDPARLGIAGDSAGGTLAAAICRIMRDSKTAPGKMASGKMASVKNPAIAFQLLICPILDIHGESASCRQLAEGYFLDRETLLRDIALYCPGADLSDPRLSPLLAADFSGLPPALIHTAQFDPFGDEGEAYAAKLSAASVPVDGQCHPGMIHYFYCMPRMIPYAAKALEMIGAEVRDLVETPLERRTQKRTRPPLIRS